MTMLNPGHDFQRSMVLNGLQVRLARQALRLTVRQVAELCGVALITLQRIEADDETVKVLTTRKVQAALENAGVEFIEDNGIRFRPKKRKPRAPK
jgi:transcriptional regulator with XRE-family HTH domain